MEFYVFFDRNKKLAVQTNEKQPSKRYEATCMQALLNPHHRTYILVFLMCVSLNKLVLFSFGGNKREVLLSPLCTKVVGTRYTLCFFVNTFSVAKV